MLSGRKAGECDLTTDLARAAEHAKYEQAYKIERYAMGQARKRGAVRDLSDLPCRGSYLDVSCGRGEMLGSAEELGFHPVQGTEIVSSLIDGRRVVRAEVHDLPFGDRSFDVASMFDVIEHLVPGDDELACRELARVAKRHILLTANNRPSNSLGMELHINRRPYDEWDALFRKWFSGTVTWLKNAEGNISETWRIDLEG